MPDHLFVVLGDAWDGSICNDKLKTAFAFIRKADAPRIKANMLSAFDTPAAECTVTVAACPVLAALPAAPFGIPPREGYSFSGSPGDSSGSQ